MANRRNGDKNVKVRILAIERMLSRDKFICTREIISRLQTRYDIYVDRKTVIDDLRAIDCLIPLEVRNGKYGGFRIMTFEDL